MSRPLPFTAPAAIPGVTVRLAQNPADTERCRNLISFVYARSYGVEMTDAEADPDGGVETFPNRFVLGEVDGEIVACAGLYTHHTYVERHGAVTNEEVVEAARRAGVEHPERRRHYEYTKVVVAPAWRNLGLGRRFIGVSHAREFLCYDSGDVPPLLLVCAKLSVFRMWHAVGIQTRHLRPFPAYRNHARYRRPEDPMESRLVIPERDVAPSLYDLTLPTSIPLENTGADHAV